MEGKVLMRDIVIVGAGGFGREILWLLQEQNKVNKRWNIKGFIDDDKNIKNVMGYPVVSTIKRFADWPEKIAAVCCIGNSRARRDIIKYLSSNKNIDFPSIIANGVTYSESVAIGKGCIICESVVMTVNIKLEDFVIVNLNCTIGHDTVLERFTTIYPGANISGNVNIGNSTEIGTGTTIIQGISVCSDSIIGAGGVVIRNIEEPGTYVGVPVNRIV